MIIIKLFLKIPYSFAWRLTNGYNNAFPIIFYCTNFEEFKDFQYIKRYLPELTTVARHRNLQNEFLKLDQSSILWPVYPKVAIMYNDTTHMFPSKKVMKILLNKDKENTNCKEIHKRNNVIILNLLNYNSRYEVARSIIKLIDGAGISF